MEDFFKQEAKRYTIVDKDLNEDIAARFMSHPINFDSDFVTDEVDNLYNVSQSS